MKRVGVLLATLSLSLVVSPVAWGADQGASVPQSGAAPKVEADGAQQTAAEDKAHDADGFFNQGLFGVCGGRKVWWGWVLGLLFYVPGLIVGCRNSGRAIRAQYEQMQLDPQVSGGAAFCSSLVGAGIGFILFWGLPGSALGWILLGVVALLAGSIASAAAAQAPAQPAYAGEFAGSYLESGRRF